MSGWSTMPIAEMDLLEFMSGLSPATPSLIPVRSFLILLLMASPAFAGEVQPKIPTTLGCKIVRALHSHYSKDGYTVAQMKSYLLSKGFSQARVDGAEKCLG